MVSIPAVPVPVSPGTTSQASEPTLSSSTATLSWNAASGATSYEVAVRDLNTNQLVVDQIVSGTSYQASLSPGGSYRWNVDAIDSAGASNFSSPLYFLTPASVSIPAVPVPISPGTTSQTSEPTLSSSTATLSWNAVSGATSYEVAVRDVNTNQLVVDQIVSGTSYQASLSPGGSYRWNVDAIDSAGASNFSSPLYFLTPASVSIPAVPVPVSPGTTSQASEPTLSSSTATLSWNAVSGATSYEVAVRDLNTNQLVVDQIVSGTSYQASLSPGGSYRWNVDAIDSAGASNFSSPLYFLTPASVSIPAVPVPISPGTTSQTSEPTLSSSTATLSWNAVSGATSYEVAVRDVNTNQLVVDQIVSGTSDQVSLSPGGSYRWNVDAIDSAGASTFSSPLYFLTPASVSIPAVPVPISPGTTSQTSEPTLSSSTATLSWNAVSGATSYEVAVRDLVTNQIVIDQTVSGTSYQASLSPGGSYRWNVDAIDSAGASNFSSPLYFLTPASVSIPAVPVPISPGTTSQTSEPTLSSSTATLSWNAVSGATSYEVAVRDLVTNQLVIDQTVSGTSYQASLSPGGPYRWNVDAIDSAGASNFSSPLYFLTPGSNGSTGLNSDIATAIAEINAQVSKGSGFTNDLGQNYFYLHDATLVAKIASEVASLYQSGSNYVFSPQGLIDPAGMPSSSVSYNQCVALIEGLDQYLSWQTSNWVQNQQVDLNGGPNSAVTVGTPIATFVNGTYSQEHAGIFLGYGSEAGSSGFFMLDQYVDQPGLTPNTQPPEVRFHPFNTEALEYYTIVTSGGGGGSTTLYGMDYRARVQIGQDANGNPKYQYYNPASYNPNNGYTDPNPYINPTDITAATHNGAHYSFVMEYIGGTNGQGYLRPSDVTALEAAGLSIVSIYERSPTDVSYFTLANADADATNAVAAASALGQTSGSAIYFTVDYGAGSAADKTAILAYFEEIQAKFNAAGSPYKIGVYADGSVLNWISTDPNLNAANKTFLWLAYAPGWPGSSGYSSETVQQDYSTPISIDGRPIDLDIASSLSFGQWGSNPATPTIIESFGSTSLTQVGNDYFLYAKGTTTGPELMYGGTPWAAGQAWAPIGVEKTSSGYEVALFNASSHLYAVWNTDSSGNVLSASISGVSGTNTALESIETSFQQDLNGDGTTGIPAPTGSTIEAFGVTKLVLSNNDYFFNPVAGGSGPELMYGGAPWAAGQAWAPIGVEKISSGYEVALFNASSHLYTIWNTDSSGNVLSASISGVSGTNTALESIETSFQQDLNGDGTTGIPAAPTGTTIEAFGVTKLVLSNNDYFFNPVAGGSGPELMYGGAPWAAGQAWAPIGVEKISSGYEVALLNASTHLYTIWNTDSSGNVLSASISGVSGTNTALESIETSFQQDLNGDGTTGIPAAPTGTTIEAFGVTKLVLSNNDYFFNPVAGGSGPELTYSGTPWAAGQAWAPIGVEKTSSGYEVALFNTSSQLYTVWNTDSSGNVLSASIAGVSGTNTALESIETSFQQDLNGDNVIGPPSHTSAQTVATAPVTIPNSGNAVLSGSAASDTFVFNANFGNDTVTGFQPGIDPVNLDHTLAASLADLFSHTAYNPAGIAAVTIGAEQSITFDSVSKLVLQQHASDFHLI